VCLQYSIAVGWGRKRERERESKQASMLMIIIMARTSWRRGRQTAWSEEEGEKEKEKKTGVGIGYFCQRNASNNEPCAIASVHSAVCGTPKLLTYLLAATARAPSLSPSQPPFLQILLPHTHTPPIPNNNPSSIFS
jgi:hypothetical protein